MSFTVGSSISASPWVFPQMPTPLKDDGRIIVQGEKIPHKGTLIDNVLLSGSFATGSGYEGFLDTTMIWSVAATDLNASANGFIGATIACWYDNTSDRLYVFAVDTGTAPDTLYTAYITLETGALTNVGNVQLTTDPATLTSLSNVAISRASVASGNFTLIFKDRTIVINSTTGAEVSNVASVNATNALGGNYATLDGTMVLEFIDTPIAGQGQVILTRNKITVSVPIPDSMFARIGSGSVFGIPWGDKVKIFINTSSDRAMTRTYLRIEFDEWLQKVADFGGLA